jgi:thioredoxin 1
MKKIAFSQLVIMIFIAGIIITACAESVDKKQAKAAADSTKTAAEAKKPLPKLIDLGSKGCIPCKKMAPILDSLREEYKGRAEIIFIDTRENRQAGLDYKISFIPTQVFIDTTGKEVYRHVGFFPADSIVAHLKALGVK